MSENKEYNPADKDESLDTLLENMKLAQPEDLDALIEKRVNRRIRQIVLRVLALILIPVILVYMVISPLMNAAHTDPYRLNEDQRTDENGSIISDSTLYRTLDAWIETQFPYTELDWVSVDRLGFGKYTINAHVFDLKQPVAVKDSANVRFTMRRDTLLLEQNFSNIKKFRRDFVSDETDPGIEKTREEISAFPDSTWFIAAVSLQEPEEIKSLLETETENLSVDWAQVYTDGNEPYFGINLSHIILNDPEGIRKLMSAEELKQLFLNRLALLKSKDNIFTRRLGISSFTSSGGVTSYFPQVSVSLISDFMETVEQTEGFASQNYYVSGSKQAVLELIDTMKPVRIRIVDARLFRG